MTNLIEPPEFVSRFFLPYSMHRIYHEQSLKQLHVTCGLNARLTPLIH